LGCLRGHRRKGFNSSLSASALILNHIKQVLKVRHVEVNQFD
jgi:hypothetical protein